MKTLTIITGFLAALVLVAGLVFKLLHFPGSMLLLAAGTGMGLLLFLPMLLLASRKKK